MSEDDENQKKMFRKKRKRNLPKMNDENHNLNKEESTEVVNLFNLTNNERLLITNPITDVKTLITTETIMESQKTDAVEFFWVLRTSVTTIPMMRRILKKNVEKME
jgi:hypothetical protein